VLPPPPSPSMATECKIRTRPLPLTRSCKAMYKIDVQGIIHSRSLITQYRDQPNQGDRRCDRYLTLMLVVTSTIRTPRVWRLNGCLDRRKIDRLSVATRVLIFRDSCLHEYVLSDKTKE
jgi:hypothetical protein